MVAGRCLRASCTAAALFDGHQSCQETELSPLDRQQLDLDMP